MCRKAKELNDSNRVPFFARPGFFPSPSKPFQLPVYVEAIAKDSFTENPRPASRARLVDPRILKFVDHHAIESDSDTSDSEGSSISSHYS